MLLWIAGIGILLGLLLFRSICPVNLGERGVVYTLGRYTRTADPGLVFLFPFVQTLRRVDSAPRHAGSELDDAVTADGSRVRAQVFATYEIADAAKYASNLSGSRDNTYSKSVIELAITKLLERTARERIAEVPLAELAGRQEEVAAELKSTLGEAVDRWGLRVVRMDLYAEPAPEAEWAGQCRPD